MEPFELVAKKMLSKPKNNGAVPFSFEWGIIFARAWRIVQRAKWGKRVTLLHAWKVLFNNN